MERPERRRVEVDVDMPNGIVYVHNVPVSEWNASRFDVDATWERLLALKPEVEELLIQQQVEAEIERFRAA